ncbi:MAG: hypothetical protein V1790_05775 [Planctomycetota bacterium]
MLVEAAIGRQQTLQFNRRDEASLSWLAGTTHVFTTSFTASIHDDKATSMRPLRQPTGMGHSIVAAKAGSSHNGRHQGKSDKLGYLRRMAVEFP